MPSSPSRADRAFLVRQPFAHRGLHGGGIVENSRAAFRAAITGGYGIELDVQAARCGTPMVFHDAELTRLTGAEGRLDARDAAALAQVRLAGTDEGVPTLAEILALVGGRTPVLVEVKADAGGVARLCAAVANVLAGYAGEAAAMSFNPRVGRWFAAHAPSRTRGLVLSEQDRGRARGALATRLMTLAVRPHFVALDVRDLPSGLSRRMQAKGVPVLTWTVRSAADRTAAAAHADQIIFEAAR